MKIVYLVFTPYTSRSYRGEILDFKKVRNTPYFFDIDIDVMSIGSEKINIQNKEVEAEYFVYDEEVFVGQFMYNEGDHESLEKDLRELALQKSGYIGSLVEEYTIAVVPQNKSAISDVVQENKEKFTSIARSLETKISYSKRDATFVDWEGAVIVTEGNEYDTDIELFKVGNYQLLKYRILDEEIEKNLSDLRRVLEAKTRKRAFSNNSLLKNTLETKLSLLLDFDKVDQSILLVGDWYSAKLYRIIVDEFYLDDWKNLVKEKLSSLGEIDDTVRQNLIFSWDRFLDIVSVVGWALLLVGYFVLYFKDVGWI